jgi:hypothetical protein
MRRNVTFKSNGDRIVGHLYVPDDSSAKCVRPALVVGGDGDREKAGITPSFS